MLKFSCAKPKNEIPNRIANNNNAFFIFKYHLIFEVTKLKNI